MSEQVVLTREDALASFRTALGLGPEASVAECIERIRASLDANKKICCGWCGKLSGPYETDEEKLAEVKRHLLECKDHPLARAIVRLDSENEQLRRERDEMAAALAYLKNFVGEHADLEGSREAIEITNTIANSSAILAEHDKRLLAEKEGEIAKWRAEWETTKAFYDDLQRQHNASQLREKQLREALIAVRDCLLPLPRTTLINLIASDLLKITQAREIINGVLALPADQSAPEKYDEERTKDLQDIIFSSATKLRHLASEFERCEDQQPTDISAQLKGLALWLESCSRAAHQEAPMAEPKFTPGPWERVGPDLYKACKLALDLFSEGHALSRFDWGKSHLRAADIRELNELPGIIRAALAKAESQNG